MIRLVIVEDVISDAELTVRQLQAEGIDCRWERVETEAEFRGALASPPDLIISDCTLPSFDGLKAMAIAATAAPATPFVFVSGTLGEGRARIALQSGAAGWVEKRQLAQLGATVRTALERASAHHRRRSDNDTRTGKDADSTGAAQHLLERRTVLDAALSAQDESQLVSLMRRTPPSPAALLMIEAAPARKRFAKLLTGAKIELDEAGACEDALSRLASRIHALLFTDNLELVRRARLLPSGAVTHIVFVNAGGAAHYGEALRAGADDCMPGEARGEQFWAHMTIVRRIVEFAASLHLALTDNRILATIDELTLSGSRRFFEHQFPREVERAGRSGLPLSLVMCDIDHFKRINDRFGHQAGDEVLKEFVGRLNHGLRASDWVARTGGEEFAVVLPETRDIDARVIAGRLCTLIHSTPFPILPQPLAVTASFGVCALDCVPRETRGVASALIKAADAALYQSKRQGRNRVSAAPGA